MARATQAAILYDEVIFEAGLLDASFTPSGSFINYVPEGMVTDDLRERARVVPEPGSGVAVSIGVQGAIDEPAPAEAMRLLFSGTLTATYAAEWESGVLHELLDLNPPWAKKLTMNDPHSVHSRHGRVTSRASTGRRASRRSVSASGRAQEVRNGDVHRPGEYGR